MIKEVIVRRIIVGLDIMKVIKKKRRPDLISIREYLKEKSIRDNIKLRLVRDEDDNCYTSRADHEDDS